MLFQIKDWLPKSRIPFSKNQFFRSTIFWMANFLKLNFLKPISRKTEFILPNLYFLLGYKYLLIIAHWTFAATRLPHNDHIKGIQIFDCLLSHHTTPTDNWSIGTFPNNFGIFWDYSDNHTITVNGESFLWISCVIVRIENHYNFFIGSGSCSWNIQYFGSDYFNSSFGSKTTKMDIIIITGNFNF